MSVKKTGIIIGIIAFAVIIGAAVYFINGNSEERNANWYKSTKLIGSPVPKDAKVTVSSDTHGGLLGDGEYFVVFQFTESQYEEFLTGVQQNKRWLDLPLSKDLKKFIFGERSDTYNYEGYGENKIPCLTRNGKYYFFDRLAEDNPRYKGMSILSRPSSNFTFGLLDIENRKLYIMKYDS